MKNPTNLGHANEAEEFEGKYNPTYFTIIGKKGNSDSVYTRDAQLDRKFRVRFKTDAVNDFFSREKYPGIYSLSRDKGACEDHIVHLHNGVATLNVELPQDAKVGDTYHYAFIVTDTNNERSFENEFDIHVIAQQEATGGNGGRRTPPDGENPDKNSFTPTGISLPNVREVSRDEWETFGFTKESAFRLLYMYVRLISPPYSLRAGRDGCGRRAFGVRFGLRSGPGLPSPRPPVRSGPRATL